MSSTATPLTLLPGGPRRPEESADAAVRDGLAEHHESLLRTALHRTRDAVEAEDLVQETYVRALRFAGSFRPGTNLAAWLHTILRNTSINRLQARSIRPRTLHPEVSGGVFGSVRDGRTPDDPVTAGSFLARRDEFDGRLHDAIVALPAIFRDVLLLSVLDGRSHREIAERLDVPVGTVMSRLHRARKALQGALAAARDADRPAAA